MWDASSKNYFYFLKYIISVFLVNMCVRALKKVATHFTKFYEKIQSKAPKWITLKSYVYFIPCLKNDLYCHKCLLEKITKRSKRFITIVKNIQVHLIHYFQLLKLSTSYIRKVIRPQIFRGSTFTAIIGFVMSVFQFQILIHPVLGQNKC